VYTVHRAAASGSVVGWRVKLGPGRMDGPDNSSCVLVVGRTSVALGFKVNKCGSGGVFRCSTLTVIFQVRSAGGSQPPVHSCHGSTELLSITLHADGGSKRL
jgi:hypothetical protein